MKKALSFAVALGLVAGMATVAVAADNLTIKGDARWRGVYKNNNTDTNDAAADRSQYMDQRYRLNADVKVNDDVKITTRFVLLDQKFGNNNSTASGQADTDDNVNPETENDNTFKVDRAHMTMKNVMGGTWSIGRMNASWGNKFFGWGSQVDRIKAVYKSNGLTTAYYLQKNVEGLGANGDQDSNTFGALVIGKAGDTKWGVIANYNVSDTDAAKASGKDTGYLADAYFVTKAGPATVLGEFFYSGGDLNDNSNEDAFYGGFVGGAMGMDAMTVKGLIAYYDGNEGGTGGRDCDNDFAPSLLIGTCQETAIIDFGQTTNTHNDSTYLIGAGIDMKINDKLTVGALLGYLMASENGVKGGDKTLIEADLTVKYQLAPSATYSFGIALGDVDEFSATDDSILVVGNRIDVKW